MALFDPMQRQAHFHRDGKHRTWLMRRWSRGPSCGFIMLNPSIASGVIDDPTVRKCIGFARLAGFGEIQVGNLFSYLATDPSELRGLSLEELTDAHNEQVLLGIVGTVERLYLAWGNDSAFTDSIRCLYRERMVEALKRCSRNPPVCLGRTQGGNPRHPLYRGYNTLIEVF